MKKLCFVIMGYGKRADLGTGKTYDLDQTYNYIIKPAVEELGITCIRGDEVHESGLIDKSMYTLLVHADLVIADITTYNPNAIYELGIRHASKPFSTIIIQDELASIPFDLNHNKIFKYKYSGDVVSIEEASRCIRELKALIDSIIDREETDSPFFEFIQTATPRRIEENDYNELIKELAEKEHYLFGIVEAAKKEMNDSNFENAIKLWTRAHDKSESDPYFIQQLALATYKRKKPSPDTALHDAFNILSKLDLENTTDTETLGIAGAINKNLWLHNKDINYLDRAIDYYNKGFQLKSDYYTGENYALCLDFKCKIETSKDEQIYYRLQAKKSREKICKILEVILDEENGKNRTDIKWIYASMSNCLLSLGNVEEAKKYEELFLKETTIKWELETFQISKESILNINAQFEN